MRLGRDILFLLTAALVWAAASKAASAQVLVERAFPNLTFEVPVDVQHVPGDRSRLFVVERDGIVRVFENDGATTSATIFLDIRDRVKSSVEEGLLGLAFHPDYSRNGTFYIFYTTPAPRHSRVAAFRVRPDDPNRADPDTEHILLEFPNPHQHHNAGQLRFGPDGYLYVAVGDGGGFYDETGTGEDLTTPLGSILRIDVNETSGDLAYSIPPSNPFVGNDEGFREEIFAYGLRNPWRFSFDPSAEAAASDGDDVRLWVGDVGAGSFEEIDLVEKGKNYGWSTLEGTLCRGSGGCDRTGRTPPVWQYAHDLGRAVIGGFVYQGTQIDAIQGRYIFADYVSGRIWALSGNGDSWESDLIAHADSVRLHTFGEGPDGELYLAGVQNGNGALYRLVSDPTYRGGLGDVPGASYLGAHPNPVVRETEIAFSIRQYGRVSVTIYDALGRSVRLIDLGGVPAGEKTVEWNGEDGRGQSVPAGLYLIRIRADGAEVATGTVIVAR